MNSPHPGIRLGAVLLAVSAVTACSDPSGMSHSSMPGMSPGSTHAHGTTFGDGLTTEVHDFRITNIALPRQAGTRGAVTFEILDQTGQPVTTMVRNQTKLLHLYVVRSDLSTFRHLHPTPNQGEWSADVTLPAPGDYRVIAEFSANSGSHVDHVILGGEGTVGGPEPARPPRRMGAADRAVRVSVEDTEGALAGQRLTVHVTDRHGHPVTLGKYLGTTGHITAFHALTGAMTHLHPSGAPTTEDDATVLTLHAGLTLPGTYVFFVQVRVHGTLHTLRTTADVT